MSSTTSQQMSADAGPITGTTAEILTRTLMAGGVDTIFALPGIQNDPLFDAFYHAREHGLRVVNPRHEQATAYMATGYGMASGKAGVFAVVPGPGFLNTTGALATAWGCSAPVVALAGQIEQRLIGRRTGLLHDIDDQLAVMRQFTKWAERISHPSEAASLGARALADAQKTPTRPVGLECAIDVWGQSGVANQPIAHDVRAAPINDQDIERAARLLARAERPLIVVGGGAQDASASIRELAHRLGAPVTANRMGRGVLSSEDPLCIDPVAGHKLWPSTDLVLAIGTRLQLQLMDWGIDDDLKVIRIDADPEAIDRIAPPEVGLVGDAATIVPALVEQLPPGSPASELSRWVAQAKADATAALATLEPQHAWLAAIRDVLPRNGIFVDEMTQLGYAARAILPVYEPRTFLSPGYQGTLGWGLPTALGAQVACPDRKVVSISGDGGFMFTVGELATAVQHNIPLVSLVVNNNGYENVARFQDQHFGGRRIASSLNAPDFVQLADSCGMWAKSVSSPDALRQTLETAFSLDAPALIEIQPDTTMPDPWSMLNFTPSRGRKAR